MRPAAPLSWLLYFCFGNLSSMAFDAACVDGRLAESCIKCIAANLLELGPHPLFASLVQASSQTVRDREETDTVPLVDDLRYHLEQLHGDGELSSGLPIPVSFHFICMHVFAYTSLLSLSWAAYQTSLQIGRSVFSI